MPELHIQLLGEFRLTSDDAPVSTVNAPRLQALLAYLLLHRGAPQPRQHLAFLLWPESREAQARTNLRQLLHTLKQALPDADQFVHANAQTLQWRSDAPFRVDVAEFEAALTQADAAEQQGHPHALRAALQQASAIYQGDLLPSCYDDWIVPERERLRQMFTAALERLMLLLESQGDPRTAIGYAERLLRHDPLREESYRALMRLYAACGDRAGALRVYHTCATVLERELAVEPSATTRQAYEQVLKVEAQARPVLPPQPANTNLPVPLTSFVGREVQMTEVRRLLQTTRLLTLTGPGGCGKTRLALEAATNLQDDYPDGAWFVNLAPIRDPALVLSAIAQVLGVVESSGQPLLESLKTALRPKRMLLLLDNFEQVLDAAPDISAMLQTAPQLRVVVTSRTLLHLSGEHEFAVPPLSVPPAHAPDLEHLTQYAAVALFIQRAQAVKPDLQVSQANTAAIAEICVRLDGLPLAIELAAARIKLFAPEALLARLGNRLGLLTGGARDLPARQQTLRKTIDWSYALLSPDEQKLFRRLAVFVGGWTLEAVEAVCNEEHDLLEVMDGLAALVDQSLVQEAERLDNAPRFTMLETIHEYALEQLQVSGEVDAIRRHAAAYYLALAEAVEPKLRSAEQQLWLVRLEAEHANLRAAMSWSQEAVDAAEPGLRLAGALGWFWLMRGYLSEGRTWLAGTLARTTTQLTLARAWALNRAGFLAQAQEDETAARALHEESLAISRALGGRTQIAWALIGLGEALRERGDYPRAAALYEESLALFRALGDTWGSARALHGLAGAARGSPWAHGDHTRAVACYEESLALFRALGDTWSSARALRGLGRIAKSQGNYEQAATLFEESLTLLREVGDILGAVKALRHLEEVAQAQGEHARAAAWFEESMTLLRKLGDQSSIAKILNSRGFYTWLQGDYERAAALYEESLALCRVLDDKVGIARALDRLGDIAREQGDYLRAARLIEESLALLREYGHTLDIALALNDLGDVALSQGALARAVTLYEESLTLYRERESQWGTSLVLRNLGRAAHLRGDDEQATKLFTESLALSQGTMDLFSSGRAFLWARVGLAQVALAQGNYTRAAALYRECLSMYWKREEKLSIAWCLEGMAGVAGAQGQPVRAARLFGATAALRVAIGAPLPPGERADYDRTVDAAHAQMDQAAFAAAWSAGRAMTLEEAVADALSLMAEE